MTETATFPFDTSTSPDDEAATGPDRRKLLLLIAVGVIVSSVVGYFLAVSLFGGAEPATTPKALSPTAAPQASALPSASPPATPRVVAGAVNRNPFLPLVYPPAAGSGGTAAAPAAPAPAVTTPAGSAATPAGMSAFKLLSVAGSQAVVTIDSVRYTVSAGQGFAGTYKLVATSGGACADFTNSGKRMSLCEGQTLLF